MPGGHYMATATLEEYLEAIYKLSEKGAVRPTQIASALEVSGPTVTATLHRLVSAGFIKRDGGDVPRITPPRVGVGFDTGWNNFALSLDYQRVFKQTRAAELEDSTSGFDLLGFDLSWKPDFWPEARFFLRGRNLLDEDGRRHQSFFRDEAPIIGRAISGGLRFDWGA
ncbi:MAG: hypothetical protein CVV18_06565 [Gammaproteobacteria bacterium HGW-Gammaproteobacteria-8]|nr:MAG: hypothetical protein CVV18_06565 [Gammaproteobacteria bacterium HGW-Gammaproteobacteria-8]